jgi:glucosylceramidase
MASLSPPRAAAWTLFALALSAPIGAPAVAQRIDVVVSSEAGDRLASKPPIVFRATAGEATPAGAILVDDSERHQKILGFGASFNEAGMICINSLAPAAQEALLKSVFDARTGAGFTMMKSPIAATDFMSAGPWYTYDDVPGDTALVHFSIARDLGPNGLVTYIKRARRYGKLTIQAPMDYPPDWMLIDPIHRQDVDPRCYDCLAHYYLRYVQEYARAGVRIDYVSLFNEPLNYTKISYPEIGKLLKEHVGPLFERSGLKGRLQLSEDVQREDAPGHYGPVLDDPETMRYVAMIPYHGYDFGMFDNVALIAKRYPDRLLWMTELCYAYEAGYPTDHVLPRYDFADEDFWAGQIMGDVGAGASAWSYWNLVLDETGGPWLVSTPHGDPPGNAQQPLIVVNRKTHEVSYTGAFYAVAHFSKFVRPGSFRIGCAGEDYGIRGMAFERPDGKIALILRNSLASEATAHVRWRGTAADVALPGKSITTCMWRK